MIKRIYIIISTLFVIIIIGFSMKSAKSADDRMLKVESAPFHNASGWGYNILVDHKVFIHQEYIPAIVGKKGFGSKEDAMKTAALAVRKLVNGQQPAITKNDLDSLKISF